MIASVRIPAGIRNPSGGFSEESIMKALFNTSREEELVEEIGYGAAGRTVVLESCSCFPSGNIQARRKGKKYPSLSPSSWLSPFGNQEAMRTGWLILQGIASWGSDHSSQVKNGPGAGRQGTTSTLILSFFFWKVEDNMPAYLKRLLTGNTAHSVGGP